MLSLVPVVVPEQTAFEQVAARKRPLYQWRTMRLIRQRSDRRFILEKAWLIEHHTPL